MFCIIDVISCNKMNSLHVILVPLPPETSTIHLHCSSYQRAAPAVPLGKLTRAYAPQRSEVMSIVKTRGQYSEEELLVRSTLYTVLLGETNMKQFIMVAGIPLQNNSRLKTSVGNQ